MFRQLLKALQRDQRSASSFRDVCALTTASQQLAPNKHQKDVAAISAEKIGERFGSVKDL